MNKYITLLTENEVLAWQNDCLNPVNRFTPVSLQETQENATLLFHGFRRLLGTFTSICLYSWGQDDWSISLEEKSSNLKTAGKKTPKTGQRWSPWRTNLIKNS